MRFHKYFFGDIPAPGDGIPDLRAALNSPDVDVLFERLLAASPGSIKACDTKNTDVLIGAGVLRRDADYGLYFDCPVFLADDEHILRELTCRYAADIAEKMLRHKEGYTDAVKQTDNRFDSGVHIYNLLCGAVFDGCFFDRLAEAGIVTVSKPGKYGDFLPVIYEDEAKLNRLSAEILCSYNRLSGKAGVFSSFGDADGIRKDMFRWYQKIISDPERMQTMVGTSDVSQIRDVFASEFVRYANGSRPVEPFRSIFEDLGYMRQGVVCVPVYCAEGKKNLVGKLDELTADIVFDDIAGALREVSSASVLTAVKHGVEVPDIANEVYHLIFGQINEALVRGGLAAAPKYRPGEGRYFKCFEIN